MRTVKSAASAGARRAIGSAGLCSPAIRLATNPQPPLRRTLPNPRIRGAHTLSVFAKTAIPYPPLQQQDRKDQTRNRARKFRLRRGSDDGSQIPRRFDGLDCEPKGVPSRPDTCQWNPLLPHDRANPLWLCGKRQAAVELVRKPDAGSAPLAKSPCELLSEGIG
jgi:hypothetical protein